MVRVRRAVVVAVVLAIAGGGVWVWRASQTTRLSDLLSPAYWLRQWRGHGLYDPQACVLYHGDPRRPEIALTFDDGPRGRVTADLLDALRADGVRATFFVVGARVVQDPQIVRRMLADGHEVGNHSEDHLRLDELPAVGVRTQLNDCDVSVVYAAGRHTRLMRPPGARFNDAVLGTTRALGYTLVSWTIGAHDYASVPAEHVSQRVLRRAENGSIVLLHCDRRSTLQAIPEIVRDLRRRGYRFVTISEMLAHLPRPVAVVANPRAQIQPVASAAGDTGLTAGSWHGEPLHAYRP